MSALARATLYIAVLVLPGLAKAPLAYAQEAEGADRARAVHLLQRATYGPRPSGYRRGALGRDHRLVGSAAPPRAHRRLGARASADRGSRGIHEPCRAPESSTLLVRYSSPFESSSRTTHSPGVSGAGFVASWGSTARDASSPTWPPPASRGPSTRSDSFRR